MLFTELKWKRWLNWMPLLTVWFFRGLFYVYLGLLGLQKHSAPLKQPESKARVAPPYAYALRALICCSPRLRTPPLALRLGDDHTNQMGNLHLIPDYTILHVSLRGTHAHTHAPPTRTAHACTP